MTMIRLLYRRCNIIFDTVSFPPSPTQCKNNIINRIGYKTRSFRKWNFLIVKSLHDKFIKKKKQFLSRTVCDSTDENWLLIIIKKIVHLI